MLNNQYEGHLQNVFDILISGQAGARANVAHHALRSELQLPFEELSGFTIVHTALYSPKARPLERVAILPLLHAFPTFYIRSRRLLNAKVHYARKI